MDLAPAASLFEHGGLVAISDDETEMAVDQPGLPPPPVPPTSKEVAKQPPSVEATVGKSVVVPSSMAMTNGQALADPLIEQEAGKIADNGQGSNPMFEAKSGNNTEATLLETVEPDAKHDHAVELPALKVDISMETDQLTLPASLNGETKMGKDMVPRVDDKDLTKDVTMSLLEA